ncbi:MAG TPA: glycosyltransferase [Candidatus Paceibacterota bacterium]|nr:glycosyltransferase [Candidatus Paceibacterota bacterium]
MKILMIVKYPPIQGGVSTESYWTAQTFAEMGHEVHVLTNADEIEEQYRIKIPPQDMHLLAGYKIKGKIFLHKTEKDSNHVFIPQNNPSVSKIVGTGLKVIKEFNPAFIWSYYLEPYGVSALFLSLLTGVPYVIKHAGSDIGRLMPTAQLMPIYKEVFQRALFVITHSVHFDRFRLLGVKVTNFSESISNRFRGDLFFPEPPQEKKMVTIGVYGKTGHSKGTYEILKAIGLLRSQGVPCVLKACWDKKNVDIICRYAETLSLGEDVFQWIDFMPHWRMPDFIKSCDMILFLENNFRIRFHTPGIPIEVLACGRPIITTSEIADKKFLATFLKPKENAFLISKEKVDSETIAEAIHTVINHVSGTDFWRTPWVNSGLLSFKARLKTEEFLNVIQDRINFSKA